MPKPKNTSKKKSAKKKSTSKSKNPNNSSLLSSNSSDQPKEKPSLKLTKIVLENFKSFLGRNEIGYFQDFSVVLGPNGSGKSNIIDAISFVLGLNAQQLRTRNLKELIYHPHNNFSSQNSQKNCLVEIFFENDTKEISFKRTVNSNGISSFYYNNKKLTQEDYIEKLIEMQVPVNSMFFILGQGGVDSLLSSKRNRIEQIIEILSGSNVYKEKYEELVKELEDKNDELNILTNQINSIKMDKNKLKAKLENKGLYKENIEKIQSLMKKIYLYQFAEQDAIKILCENNLEEYKNEIEKAEMERKNETISMKENEKLLTEKKNNIDEIMKKEMELQKELDIKKNNMNIQIQEIKKNENELFNAISLSNQMKEDLKRKDDKKSALISEKNAINKEIINMKKILNSNIDDKKSKLTKEQINEFKTLSLSLQSSISEYVAQLSSLEINIQNSISKKSLLEKTLSQLEMEKNSVEEDSNTLSGKILTMQNNIKEKGNKINEMKKKFEKLNQSKDDLAEKYKEIYSSLENKIVELSTFKVENNESRRRKKIGEFMIKNDKVYGFLFELIKPLQKKFELPIKVSLLKYLDYLVVENYETSVKISEFLQNNELNADVLVLENIPTVKEIDQTKRIKLGSEGNFIYDLIESKKKSVENAIKFFLRDLILCNPENIHTLRQRGFRNFITEDGTVYRKHNITGGNYKNLDRYNFIYKTKEESEKIIKDLKKDIDKLSEEMKDIMSEQEKNENDLKTQKKYVEEEQQLNLLKIELNNNENLHRKQRDIWSEKENVIKYTEKCVEDETKNLEKLTKNKEDLSDKINNIKIQYFRDFMKKYHLKNLDDFEQFTIEKINALTQNLKIKDEKLIDIERKLKTFEEIQQKIDDIENDIENYTKLKSNSEKNKQKYEKEYNKANQNLQEFKKSNENRLNDIKNLQNTIKTNNETILKIDERIRKLIKGKAEVKHKIEGAVGNKQQLMKDIITDQNKILKELDEKFQDFALIFQLDFDINQYNLKVDLDETINKNDYVMDYSDIEKKNKISELTPERIQQIIIHKKEKLTNYLKEIQNYVLMYVTFDKDEENELKDKEDKLNNEKKDIKKKIDTLISEQENIKNKLSEIKEKRKSKFMDFFNKLKNKLSDLYNNLTKKDNIPGGNAFLYCSNEDEPYNGQIIYLPTPPGKRVIYDIEQLSGGEKTIAIVSLLSSLQNITNCPLLILDEVDAYLDQKHELILEKLFTESKNEFQVIIVTHKLNIYKSAESLLGTYYNKKIDSSVPISYNNK